MVTPVQPTQEALARALLPLFVFLMDATETPITATTPFPPLTVDQLASLARQPPEGLDAAAVEPLRGYLRTLPWFNPEALKQSEETRACHRALFQQFLVAWSRRGLNLASGATPWSGLDPTPA